MAAAPMLPPDPPRFSTMTCWPRSFDNQSAITRAVISTAPPAGNPAMKWIGRVGYFSAATVDSGASRLAPARLPAPRPSISNRCVARMSSPRRRSLVRPLRLAACRPSRYARGNWFADFITIRAVAMIALVRPAAWSSPPSRCGLAENVGQANDSLWREENGELVVHASLQVFAVQRVAAVAWSDLAKLNVLDGPGRDHHNRRRNWHQLRAAPDLQRSKDAIHLPRNGGSRHNNEAILALAVDDQIDVPGLIGHRDGADVAKLHVDALGFAEHQARALIIPCDLGAIGVDGIAVTERRAQRQVSPLNPRYCRPGVVT